MLSTPPPMAASAPPIMIWWAAMRDGLQARGAEAVDGGAGHGDGQAGADQGHARDVVPCGPLGWAQPRITSSISLGSSWGALPRTSLMQWAARSSGRVMLNDPRWDLARGVRELATMTASLMVWLLSWGGRLAGIIRDGRRGRIGTAPVTERLLSLRARLLPARRARPSRRGAVSGARRMRRATDESFAGTCVLVLARLVLEEVDAPFAQGEGSYPHAE